MTKLYVSNTVTSQLSHSRLHHQAGFTLIELMVSLALGLVIAAAATTLFLTGQKSFVLQAGVTEVQDNANFGLNYIVKDIRLANLNIARAEVNDETSYGGIVLTSSANATTDPTTTPATPLSNLFRTITGASAGANLLSRSHGMTAGTAPAWTGASNVRLVNGANINSDQLTIQYIPQYVRDDRGTEPTNDDVWDGGYDCEGRLLRFPVEDPGGNRPFGRQMVVQRYFLRADTNMGNEQGQPLALACEAGFYALTQTGVTRVEGGAPDQVLNTATFGSGSGQIIMRRVDHFRILLGVQNDTAYRYMSINEYMAITAGNRPRILSVQLGALVRSAQPVGNDAIISPDQSFQVLDQTVQMRTSAANSPKYVRQVVSQTIALRNTFGER